MNVSTTTKVKPGITLQHFHGDQEVKCVALVLTHAQRSAEKSS